MIYNFETTTDNDFMLEVKEYYLKHFGTILGWEDAVYYDDDLIYEIAYNLIGSGGLVIDDLIDKQKVSLYANDKESGIHTIVPKGLTKEQMFRVIMERHNLRIY